MTKKILLLSHNFNPFIGGIEIISQFLAKAFSENGFEVHLLTWSSGESQDVFPFKVIRNPGLKTLFQEHLWADLVFENNPCLRLSWPRLIFKNLSIITLHTWVTRNNGNFSLKEKLKLRWLSRADRVIACSIALKKRCCPDSLVIQNPFQEKVFRRISSVSRNKEFIFLGRMVSDKGAELALRAIHKICMNKKFDKNLQLTIVGDGPERNKLEQLRLDLNLQNNVEFTGSQVGEKLVEILNQHRFLLVPSTWEEPFGIVVLEGMACGCLPIVSNGGGLPEAVGNAGMIFKRGNLDDLVECMQQALENKELVHKYRNESEAHLAKHRSCVIARSYIEVVEDLFKQKQYSDIHEISI